MDDEQTIISLMINDDIVTIIQHEDRTVELNSKYKGLDLDDLNNFKSSCGSAKGRRKLPITCELLLDANVLKGVCLTSVFVPRAKKALNFNLLSLSKRECKTNYPVDSYFKDTLLTGPSKTDKAPKMPRALKQIGMCVIFCSELYSNFIQIAKISVP